MPPWHATKILRGLIPNVENGALHALIHGRTGGMTGP
jgi:hypothetical protein